MSTLNRHLRLIVEIIQTVVGQGKQAFRPGHINDVLRERNLPVGNWQVRADFSELESLGLIECDASTGDWHITEAGAHALEENGK